jgi:hypothetical protein
MYEKEYYVIDPGGPNVDKHPNLRWLTHSGLFNRGEFYGGNDPDPIEFGFCYTVPDDLEYEMCDFHTAPEMVISKRVRDVLASLNIKGIQLVEAMILGFNFKKKYKDYYLLHILRQNRLECIDKELSEIEYLDDDNPDLGIFGFKKFVFNKDMLDSIPQEERLFIRVKGSPVLYVCHESIKGVLEIIKPEGMAFYRVDKWNSSSVFE